jgi:hypothetical protein
VKQNRPTGNLRLDDGRTVARFAQPRPRAICASGVRKDH